MKKNIILVIVGLVLIIGGVAAYVYLPMAKPAAVDTMAKKEIISRNVKYDGVSEGFLVEPKVSGNYPGVIMVHEWWGLTEDVKKQAEELAKEGYYVLAVDLYKGKVATLPPQALAYKNMVNQAEALKNMQSAQAYLSEKGATKVGVLGWCFGGGQSLALALSGATLDATVIYYGTPLVTDARLSKIASPVLGIFGDKDTALPVATAKAFDAQLDTLGIANEIHIYPEVGHAFANPSGDNYVSAPAKDAWQKTLTFLATHLKTL